MKTRIITALVGLLILALVFFTFDTIIFNLCATTVALIATHEVFNAVGFTKKEWPLFAVQIPYALLVFCAGEGDFSLFVIPATVILLLFYGIYLVARNGTVSFQKTSGLVFFSAMVFMCFYSIVYLKNRFPVELYEYDAIFFIFLTFSFGWGSDSCAYFAGRAFGKRKLCPNISPHKTVEGAIGGVLGAITLALLMTYGYINLAGRQEAFSSDDVVISIYGLVAILALFASILGIYGDLFASVVKRQCGIKDYGTIFPGHGGILDRFDSVMFIAPFAAVIISLAFTSWKT